MSHSDAEEILFVSIQRWTMLFALVLSAVTTPSVALSLEVGTAAAEPGSRASGVIVVPDAGDAGVEIPVTVVNGREPGPVLALIAGVHGYEYPPILALQRLRAELDPEVLRGAVILVHIANPESFYRRTIYYNPIDGKNLNRAFPGAADGSHSERVAHALTTQVIEQADYVIDLHAGDGNEVLRPFVYMPKTGDRDLDEATRRMALAFGIDHIVIDETELPAPDRSQFTDYTALTRGIPAITTETGQLGSTAEQWVSMALAGIRNVLAELSMTDTDSRDPAEAVTWLIEPEVLTSPDDGLFLAEVRDGYVVAANGRLGRLVDPFGDEIAVIRSPIAGVVNYVVGTPPVRAGEPLAMVSRIAEATDAE